MTMLLFLINNFLDYDLSMTPTTFYFSLFFLSLVTNAFKSDKNQVEITVAKLKKQNKPESFQPLKANQTFQYFKRLFERKTIAIKFFCENMNCLNELL